MTTKKVVVLGGGFAGATVAHALDKDSTVEVTLISDRAHVFIKYGAMRAAVAGAVWADRAMVPLARVVRRGRVVVGEVVAVDDAGKTVRLADGQTIAWDVLVCATGSRSKSMAEPPEAVTTTEGFKAYWGKTRAALASYKSVVVVGGGPIGIEFAGEVRAAFPQTKITLVTGKAGLLGLVRPPFPAKFTQSLADLLASLDIQLVRDDVAGPSPDPAEPVVVPANGKVKLASGAEIAADAVFFGVGVALRSTSIYPAAWQDNVTKELLVQPNYLVKGRADVFALGDLARTGRTKLGYLAAEDGGKVAKNVRAVVAGKEPKATFAPMKSSIMIVPVGPKRGRSYLPFGVVGDWTTATIKGKGLFENTMWKALAEEPAPKVM